MNQISQSFRWDLSGGTCIVGKNNFLEVERSGIEPCILKRKLSKPIVDTAARAALALRFVIGKTYRIRFCTSSLKSVAQITIRADGWISYAANGKECLTAGYLTWFRGRPVVDPAFYIIDPAGPSYKTAESDVHCLSFSTIDFERRSLTFTWNHTAQTLENAVDPETEEISYLEILMDGNRNTGHIVWIESFTLEQNSAVIEHERFPIFWEPQPDRKPGYPDDSSTEASTCLRGCRWLECSGKYSWVIGHLPDSIAWELFELTFSFMARSVHQETCLEMHSRNGTMAQAMIPVKVGILQGKFFFGFASEVWSSILKAFFWKTQQAWVEEIEPEANKEYHVRIVCGRDGYYSLWINDIPIKFTGVSKTGFRLDPKKHTIPGYRIPYINEYIEDSTVQLTDIALHFGTLEKEVETVSMYGDIFISPLNSSVDLA